MGRTLIWLLLRSTALLKRSSIQMLQGGRHWKAACFWHFFELTNAWPGCTSPETAPRPVSLKSISRRTRVGDLQSLHLFLSSYTTIELTYQIRQQWGSYCRRGTSSSHWHARATKNQRIEYQCMGDSWCRRSGGYSYYHVVVLTVSILLFIVYVVKC